jgi:hypothetical protein
VSAVEATRGRGRPYDPAARKRAQRAKRYTGVWVYIPGEVMSAAGYAADEPAPWYRLNGYRRSRNAGSVIVSLYREP